MRAASGQYVVEFADSVGPPDPKGLHILDAATNLPDGTVVDLYFFSIDVESPSTTEVDGGVIPIRVANNTCHWFRGEVEGSAVRVRVTILPFRQVLSFGGVGARPPSPIPQPGEVQSVLGPNFEKLSGPQVKHENGRTYLEASAFYALPAETCRSWIDYDGHGSFKERSLAQRPRDQAWSTYPQAPFASCPNLDGALPVEAGSLDEAVETTRRFDAALIESDTETARSLLDPSVVSIEGWKPVPSPGSANQTGEPGAYSGPVEAGCGPDVALRTWGVWLEPADGRSPGGRFYLVLRKGGWKVWGAG